jgi:hypothetical protein
MKEKRTSDFVGAILGNVIGIVLVNTVLVWRQYTHGVILESWVDILWAANLSLVVQIVGNAVLSAYRPARAYSFIQAVHSAAGLLSTIVFFVVFPLDFSQVGVDWLNTLVKAVLILGMVGASIGVIVNLVRAAAGTPYTQVEGK